MRLQRLYMVLYYLLAASDTTLSKEKPTIYLNIIVKDPSRVISNQVNEKLGAKDPGTFSPKKVAADVASKVASNVASSSMVAKKMSEKLPNVMPKKMKTKGITTSAECVFLEGPYLVVQLVIRKVDPSVMASSGGGGFDDSGGDDMMGGDGGAIEATATATTTSSCEADGEEKKGSGRGIVSWLKNRSKPIRSRMQENVLPSIIQKKMPSMMTEMLSEKLDAKGMEAEAVVLPEAKQARFFYGKLKEIRK